MFSVFWCMFYASHTILNHAKNYKLSMCVKRSTKYSFLLIWTLNWFSTNSLNIESIPKYVYANFSNWNGRKKNADLSSKFHPTLWLSSLWLYENTSRWQYNQLLITLNDYWQDNFGKSNILVKTKDRLKNNR